MSKASIIYKVIAAAHQTNSIGAVGRKKICKKCKKCNKEHRRYNDFCNDECRRLWNKANQ